MNEKSSQVHCFLHFVRDNKKSIGRHFGLKLNSTHQLVVYVDVNVLGGSVPTVKKKIETLVFASPKWTRIKC
jgi:hypothetical protein